MENLYKTWELFDLTIKKSLKETYAPDINLTMDKEDNMFLVIDGYKLTGSIQIKNVQYNGCYILGTMLFKTRIDDEFKDIKLIESIINNEDNFVYDIGKCLLAINNEDYELFFKPKYKINLLLNNCWEVVLPTEDNKKNINICLQNDSRFSCEKNNNKLSGVYIISDIEENKNHASGNIYFRFSNVDDKNDEIIGMLADKKLKFMYYYEDILILKHEIGDIYLSLSNEKIECCKELLCDEWIVKSITKKNQVSKFNDTIIKGKICINEKSFVITSYSNMIKGSYVTLLFKKGPKGDISGKIILTGREKQAIERKFDSEKRKVLDEMLESMIDRTILFNYNPIKMKLTFEYDANSVCCHKNNEKKDVCNVS